MSPLDRLNLRQVQEVIPEVGLLGLEVFGHHVCYLFFSSYVFEVYELLGAYFHDPIQIYPVGTM